ncbi:hypothetical protein [Wolbachia endosymbiont (group A) of Colletes cunicularius]|uniref:hypothetical protein n=1 Tax=Wolbachia endosymbiont (group A) of Colletes cunicularius TaxID=3139321 RepID=UPI0035C8809A
MGPAPQIDFNIKTPVNDITGYSTKAWCTIKKYSINNTLPIAAVNTWLQFSLAYVTAMVITLNDLSFIATFNPTLMPTYFLVSIILGVVLLTSLALRYIYKQEIKNEKSKDGDSPIDIKIRGGKSDEINEIAQNALTIEIVPDLVDKKQGFSIVLPISEKQGEILENKRQENRNKVILLTVPYVLSGLIVAGALIQNKFSFANVHGRAEWGFIAFVSAFFIAGICIALSKLKSNEVNNACNIVKKFDNVDILLPWRKGSVVSVMENKFESKEENDPISRLIKLLDKHLTEFTDKISDLFDKFLVEARTSIDEKLLEPANVNIEATLNGIRGDLKVLFNNLEEIIEQDVDKVKKNANTEITTCLKGISKSIGESLKEIRTELKEKLNQLQSSGIGNYLVKFVSTTSNRQAGDTGDSHDQNHSLESDDEEEFFDCSALTEKIKKEIIQEVRKIINDVVQNKLEPIQKQLATLQANGSPDSALGSEDVDNIDQFPLTLEDTVKARRKTVRNLELEEENNRLIKKEQKLTQRKSEQEKTDEWKEKINGNPSEFLHYILESIKLEEKDNKEKKVEATLRNFDNKIIIHWKDGSQTTCHIKKQGDLPSTKVDFVNQNIQAAWEMMRGKSL